MRKKAKPKQYTDQFKEQAVALAASLDSVSEAAKQLGISEVTLHHWRKYANLFAERAAVSPIVQDEELARFRNENAELKKINEILKRATAFFSQESLK